MFLLFCVSWTIIWFDLDVPYHKTGHKNRAREFRQQIYCKITSWLYWYSEHFFLLMCQIFKCWVKNGDHSFQHQVLFRVVRVAPHMACGWAPSLKVDKKVSRPDKGKTQTRSLVAKRPKNACWKAALLANNKKLVESYLSWDYQSRGHLNHLKTVRILETSSDINAASREPLGLSETMWTVCVKCEWECPWTIKETISQWKSWLETVVLDENVPLTRTCM